MTPDDDPGWPRGLEALLLLVPGGIQLFLRRRGASDGLVIARAMMLAFSLALVLFAVVLALITPAVDSIFPWLALIVAIAAASLIAERFIPTRLDCTSDTTLAGSYRTRFFLRVACAEAVALFGFTFSFIGAGAWIYYLAATFTLVSFWTNAAPTRRALARDQARLDAEGCDRSLVRALRNTPQKPGNR